MSYNQYKKTITSFLLFLTILFSSTGKAQDFQWARQIGGQGQDESNAIEVDKQGNSYVIGVAQSMRYDIDPTINGSQIIDNTLNLMHPSRDVYLIKENDNGDFLWGKTFGAIKYDQYAYQIKIGTDDNIYLFLKLLDSNDNGKTLNDYITIVKIDPNGNELSRIMIKDPTATSPFFVNCFDIDNQNNFIISGWFTNTVKIDFNNTSINFKSNRLASFILKLDNTGNFIWQKTYEYPELATNEIHVKPDGNIIAIQNGSSNGYSLYNILNIDSKNGDVIWEKKLTNQSASCFHLDHLGNIIIAGNNGIYQGDIDVDPSLNTVSVSSQKYLLWLNSNGDFLDVKEYYVREFKDELHMLKIQSDIQNNIYVVGDYRGKIDADPSSHQFYIEDSRGNHQFGDGFLMKFDSDRNFDNAFSFNSDYRLVIKDLKLRNDNIFLIGDFNSYCDLDPSTNIAFFSSFNGGIVTTSDGFIVKLGPCDSSKVVGNSNQNFCSASNPTISNINPNSSSINWYDSSNSSTPLAKTSPLLDNKKYYATRKNGNCPESTERLEVLIHISSSPQAPTPITPEFCKNDNAKLTDISISGQNVKWYTNASDVSNIPITTLLENGSTYYVSQTVNGCESPRTPILVLIHNTASPTTTSPQSYCIQQNATLSNISITGQNIKWYDALINGNLLTTTTLLQNGITYYASQTINDCESERTPVTINIQNTLAPTANNSQSFCSTQNATLNDIAITGTSIKWYSDTTNGTLLPSSTSLQNGITYYATQTINNCESTSRIPVTISLINTLNATNYTETICDDLNNNFETVDLSNYNSHLISSTTETFRYYTSRNAAENQVSANQITNYSNYNLSIGQNTFYVRIDSPNTCHQIVELQLTLVSKPIITIPDIVPICENNSVIIDAGAGSDTYLWSNGASTPSIIMSNPGNYSVIVTKNYGAISCSSTKNFIVKKSNKASITSIETKDWTDNDNVIIVYATGAGDYEYSIDTINYQDSHQFLNVKSGEYTVSVRDKDGCGTVTDTVFLLMFPKFFTPNGDGHNDTWKIKFSDIEENLTVQLFDRYGKLLKTLFNNDSWDGTFNGAELPASDYWFVVTRADGTQHKGHFSLKR